VGELARDGEGNLGRREKGKRQKGKGKELTKGDSLTEVTARGAVKNALRLSLLTLLARFYKKEQNNLRIMN
jgi:hypothetical protein